MNFINQYLSCTDHKEGYEDAQKSTRTSQRNQFPTVLKSVEMWLKTSTEALEQIPYTGLHEEDQNALQWMHTSFDDMLATIHALLRTHDHRYPNDVPALHASDRNHVDGILQELFNARQPSYLATIVSSSTVD
ncbi:hypothetical protein [Arthrobacter sp. SX1312]|uniref:hypothetical protein n=1 Tax=Arthrobacter sp. SX1312 TaxID=2058896 RepID=UPI0011B02E94|nr:hypothetical protein [Arthrobacter sp. SX1312]